jgi:glycosyltransferase involved in cell wall biosynthesis
LKHSRRQISILFVIDGLEFGGGERVFLQLASGLKDYHKIFVATDAAGRFAYELSRSGIELFPVNMSRQLTLEPIRQIINIIHDNTIDLVHSQGARADFFARIAGRIANAPHILCTIAMPVEGFEIGPPRKRIYRIMDRFTERFVKRFITVSESLKEALIEGRGISSQRVVRIYNGIELDKFRPDLKQSMLKKKWGITQGRPLIGALGRMVWQKGFTYLIEAIPDILQFLPSVRFVIAGDGPLKKELESLAEDLNVREQVIFPGFIGQIEQFLSNIDILVVPSVLEGFPMVTLEAMAMGIPIVATQINGVTEQISHGQEGILVPPRNPRELAGAVLRLIEDEELGARLGLAARKKIESCFSIERMVRETEQLYLSLLKPN